MASYQELALQNMMSRRTILATSLATLYCGAIPSTAQTIESDDFVFGMLLPLTGPFAFVSRFHLQAITDYERWINSEGGVAGRRLRVVIEDTSGALDRAMAAFKRTLASEDPIALFGDSTTFVRASAAENRERVKRFMTSMSFASDLVDRSMYPFHYMPGPTYADSVSIIIDYISRNRKAGKTPKLAIMHAASEFGRDPIAFAVEYAKTKDVDISGVFEMRTRELDVTLEVIKLRKSKPDFVLAHGFGGAPAFIEVMKLARDYGMDCTFAGTFWETSRLLMKASGEVANGFTGASNYAFETANASESEFMLKTIDRLRRAEDPNYDGFPSNFYMQAWTSMMVMTKAIEEAYLKGQDLTGPNLSSAINSLRDWDTGGVIGSPVTFRDGRIPMSRMVRFDASRGMYPEPVSEWLTAGADA